MTGKYQVVVSKSVGKSFYKIPIPWRERIARAIDLLPENPFMGEKLLGKLQGKRKIRIHPYRIIYELDNKNKRIIVFDIGHRQGAYKK